MHEEQNYSKGVLPCSGVGRDQLVRDLPRQVRLYTALIIVPDLSKRSPKRGWELELIPRPQLSKDLEVKAQLQVSPGLPQDRLC